MPASSPALTDVPGLLVGHWTDRDAATGCTVVIGPAAGMAAAASIRGRATGTRELDALSPRHLVPRIDAILLTGGSAYGLGAADGVLRWLRERDRGFHVGPNVVPIVPAAVIFDLGLIGRNDRWPGPDDGYAACEAAGSEIEEGSVGAGTGATVGKVLGPSGAMKGGVGTWSVRRGRTDHRRRPTAGRELRGRPRPAGWGRSPRRGPGTPRRQYNARGRSDER